MYNFYTTNQNKVVSTSIKDKVVIIKVDVKKGDNPVKLASYLKEQAEIWLNKDNLQKELDKLDKEKDEEFTFS